MFRKSLLNQNYWNILFNSFATLCCFQIVLYLVQMWFWSDRINSIYSMTRSVIIWFVCVLHSVKIRMMYYLLSTFTNIFFRANHINDIENKLLAVNNNLLSVRLRHIYLYEEYFPWMCLNTVYTYMWVFLSRVERNGSGIDRPNLTCHIHPGP